MSNNDALLQVARQAFSVPCKAVIKLIPENGAPLFVDARQTPPTISHDAPSDQHEPNCTWHGSTETLTRTLSSKRAIENSIINGRLVISGDMSVMARLQLADSI